MKKITKFYPTSFCELKLIDTDIKHFQVGNINYQYELPNKPSEKEISLFLEVDKILDKREIDDYFKGNETEYFKKNNKTYYRNCNTIVSVEGKELFYRGKLFNSLLHVLWEEKREGVKINLHVTNQYLFESRSRLTRSSSFDTFLNFLIMHFATDLGLIPFHAAAINLTDNNSAVFMGLPNTGKTTTSVSLSKKMNSQLVAEDIIFIDKKTLKLYSCPFTMNPKSDERFKSDTYIGNKVHTIVSLKRSDRDPYLKRINSNELKNDILNMNYFEFSWLHDNLIRHLFFGGRANLKSVSEKYRDGQTAICSKVSGLELGGNNPNIWADLLQQHFIKN